MSESSPTTAASSAPATSAPRSRSSAARHALIRAGRPQTGGHVEALHQLILEVCWRPAWARSLYVRFPGVRRDLADYTHDYSLHRVHLTRGRIPADIVYGARTVRA